MTRAFQPAAHSSTTIVSADARRFAEQLHRFRQRLRLLAAFRALCLALPIALAVAFGTAWLFLPGASLLAVLSIAVVLAVVTAIVGAASFAPDLASTAASLDRRAALKNYTATALQFLDSRDAMASLVVRHGAARLSALEPRTLFALEYPPQRQVIAALGIASVLVLGAHNARRAGPDADIDRGTRAATAPGASQASRAARPAGRGQQAARAGGARVLQPAPSPSSAPVEPRQSATADTARLTGGQDRGPAPVSSTKPNAQPSGGSADPASVSPAAASGTGAGARAANAAAAGRSTAGDATHAAGRAAAQGGANALGRTERGGGGVKGGTLDGWAASVVSKPRAASARGAIGSAASSSRTESLLAEDRVPPVLREYVKRYFAAIRAGSWR